MKINILWTKLWTKEEAIQLCIEVEKICPEYGCHVALTGGLLYKEGRRKDCDILFYRIRQWSSINTDDMWKALERIGIFLQKDYGWVCKASYKGKTLDCFFPESSGGHNEY